MHPSTMPSLCPRGRPKLAMEQHRLRSSMDAGNRMGGLVQRPPSGKTTASTEATSIFAGLFGRRRKKSKRGMTTSTSTSTCSSGSRSRSRSERPPPKKKLQKQPPPPRKDASGDNDTMRTFESRPAFQSHDTAPHHGHHIPHTAPQKVSWHYFVTSSSFPFLNSSGLILRASTAIPLYNILPTPHMGPSPPVQQLPPASSPQSQSHSTVTANIPPRRRHL